MNKLTYLFIIPSSVQMYSGTGRVIKDWIRNTREIFDFYILMDVGNVENYRITKQICESYGVKLITGIPTIIPGCNDFMIENINSVCDSLQFDYIEIVSWANAATNLAAVLSLPKKSEIIFTPHYQPINSIPNYHKYFSIEPFFEEIIQRVNYIFADSPWERDFFIGKGVPEERVHYIPLGVSSIFTNFDIVKEKNNHSKVINVSDWREIRKRNELLVETLKKVFIKNNNIDFLLIGKSISTFKVPKNFNNNIRLYEDITDSELKNLYSESSVYICLSDYEAFCLPIAEALCSGCFAIINKTPILESIYSNLPGIVFANNYDTDKVAELIIEKCNKAELDQKRIIANSARNFFNSEKLTKIKLSILLNRL